MKNYYVPISIIIATVIIGGVIVYTTDPKPTQTPLSDKQKEEVKTEITISEQDHIRGNPEAQVTIIEYSDFECSFCGKFHSTVQQILKDYPDKVRWAYKHFPLDQIHSQARPAAEASECIWEQKGNDSFWQFADGLFESQNRLGEELYQELAKNLGLNMDQFNNCFSLRKYKDKVETDLQEGIKAGVRGTPGSFVNSEPISGAVPYETLKAAIERALSSSF